MDRLRNGGWVLVLAIIVFGVAGWWQISEVRRHLDAPRQGDGADPRTYGFDLSPTIVDTTLLVGSGLPRDGIDILDFPPLIGGTAADVMKGVNKRGHYVVGHDRVVGVQIGGHARAYPIRVLRWHEVVNDTLGGEPIAVSYSPRTDAAVVFHRNIGGLTCRIGYSGLIWNQASLVYEMPEGPEGGGLERAAIDGETGETPPYRPSLFSPLRGQALFGERAGTSLTILPSDLTHWSDWWARHPGTTLPDPDLRMMRNYQSDPYGYYEGHDELDDLPLSPMPPDPAETGVPRKARVIGVRSSTRAWAIPIATMLAHADANGEGRLGLPGGPFVDYRVLDRPEAATVKLVSLTADVLTATPAYWFAWHAMYPDGMCMGLRPARDAR